MHKKLLGYIIKKIRFVRYLLYKRRLKYCGKNVVFSNKIIFHSTRNISIGNNVRIGPRCVFPGQGGIEIGNNVSFGPDVLIWSANHNYNNPNELPYDSKYIRKKVFIENNVWIGARVSVVPGVVIGEGAVVALGAVVTKDVPPCSVVGGNPARILKYRDIETYNKLKANNKFHKNL